MGSCNVCAGAQEQEVLADLISDEDRRITLEVFGQFADVPDVFFFGRRSIIFELDELLELCDGRVVVFHRWERMPSREDKTAHPILPTTDESRDATPPPAAPSGSVQLDVRPHSHPA